ncbi:glycine cleavage system protein GcvH [Cloacibacillus evryensis]|uniref:Glycine cleavage system H protein n=1 Tax=Cloacibacillus evryensis TaxID=508460 RepID=A0AAW5K335_9BACT|nr:glycine cleavage system protein GcvH [Cloacibacillus evryensis]EXG78925.1 glycine cleavage system H protein [Cloacibacillus evryensis DSM 19522]MCQ4763367.1 glycine cleavage system protein GcvH [Cloacibacillus evryensis]MCQ4813514.1 glycine cleavage system protein GcvH [Cloacibacillus evryensis]MEA5036205.1 glycine cleavage system protein GcvH [Cloacibacillus evryensis]
MNIQSDLKYTKSHEWVKDLGGNCALLGLDDYAQDQLGELVFINLPEVGDEVTAGEAFGDVESVKAVSDVFSGVTGKVAEANAELADKPQKVNEDPFGAWLIKVEDITAYGDLMDAKEYEAYCASL